LKRLTENKAIIGTTHVEVRENPLQAWFAQAVKSFDAGQLNLNGASPMLVFGDGLSAGWRDDGLFRIGQQNAFPNLIAHQLGIKNFTSPLFDPAHGNGTGYFVTANQGDKSAEPTWLEVTNNLGILKLSNVPELVPYTGGDVDNMSQPKITLGSISGTLSPKENGWVYDDDGRGWTDDMIFFWRMKPAADKYKDTYYDLIKNSLSSKRPAIMLSVFGFDQWTDRNVKQDVKNMDISLSQSETSPLTITVAKMAQLGGTKGIVFTVPMYKHLPYAGWQAHKLQTAQDIDWGTPNGFNRRITQEAEKHGLLVVDLAQLYTTIHGGNYLTDDGLIINGKAGGNFFSEDGLYPSAIGHAVIANETIKVLNAHYKSKIPLINVTEFASFLK
jgi:hypothetical protein